MRADIVPSQRGTLAAAFLRGIRPPRRRPVWQWAEDEREVSAESGSPQPGKWRNAYVPEMIEPMDCLSLDHPARNVVLKKSAHVGGSESGLNLIGSCIQDNPCPILVVLPTTDEMRKWVRLKLQPMIDSTKGVKAKVRAQKSRDEDGSTTTFKRFEGGFLQITGANSSAGLQMISVRIVIREEVSEYPFDVDNRGDPVDLSEQRKQGWEGREKTVDISTPGHKGTCRITKRYDASDQRVRYLPCPQCGTFQPLVWERLDREASPPVYVCVHGCVIPESAKPGMRSRGIWIKTFLTDAEIAEGKTFPKSFEPEQLEALGDRITGRVLLDGRQPGFAINALYSPTKGWQTLIKEWREAQGVDEKMRVFTQQVLGEPWEAKGEAPDHEKLFEARAAVAWRQIPPRALFLTCGVDVQGDRLEWGVYAWGFGFTATLIDKGVIEGDPNCDPWTGPWKRLTEEVLEKTWPDMHGRKWRLDALGVDTGYLTNACYRWVRQYAATGRVFGLKGMDGWRRPPLGSPTKQDIDWAGKKLGAVLLWPVGTWDLKSEHYSALGKLLKGAAKETGEYPLGTLFYGDTCDAFYLQQVTAEQLVTRKGRNGATEQAWELMIGRRNEALDIAVYARALAHQLADGLPPERWQSLAAERGARPEDIQRDMTQLWSPPVVEPEHVEPSANLPKVEPREPQESQQQASGWLGDRARKFWN